MTDDTGSPTDSSIPFASAPQADDSTAVAGLSPYAPGASTPTAAAPPSEFDYDPLMRAADTVLGPRDAGQPGASDDLGSDPLIKALNQIESTGNASPAPSAPPVVAAPSVLDQVKQKTYEALQGLGGSFHGAEEAINTVAGAVPVMLDKLHSVLSGQTETGLQDAWFKTMVDPDVAEDADFQLGPNARFADKAVHAAGSTVGMISQAILTGPESTAANSATFAARATTGIKAMTAPAAIQAVNTGRQVLQETNDPKKALAAGAVTYMTNALMGAVPMSVGGRLPARVATGAAIGGAAGEAQRQAMNAVVPDSMQQPFDVGDTAISSLMGAAFGALPGHANEGATPTQPAAPAEPAAPSFAADMQRAAATVRRAQDASDQAASTAQANVSGMTDEQLARFPRYNDILKAATGSGMSQDAAAQYARQTFVAEFGQNAGMQATATTMDAHLATAEAEGARAAAAQNAKPAADTATNGAAATANDFSAVAQQARAAGVDRSLIRAVSQGVIRGEFTPDVATNQLRAAMQRKTPVAPASDRDVSVATAAPPATADDVSSVSAASPPGTKMPGQAAPEAIAGGNGPVESADAAESASGAQAAAPEAAPSAPASTVPMSAMDTYSAAMQEAKASGVDADTLRALQLQVIRRETPIADATELLRTLTDIERHAQDQSGGKPRTEPSSAKATPPADTSTTPTQQLLFARNGQQQASDEGSPFYSAAIRAAEGLPQEKASGQQWYSTLANRPGVKPEELDWMGLKDWLGSRPSVTKPELLDYMQAHQIQLHDVERTGKSLPGQFASDVRYLHYKREQAPLAPEDADRLQDLMSRPGTKWGEYKPKGGSNYRELLMALPGGRRGGDYQSAHWAEPNVLAHARVDDRTGEDGKRVLFIHELQSDWHQQGRRAGYRTEALQPRTLTDEEVRERAGASKEEWNGISAGARNMAHRAEQSKHDYDLRLHGPVPEAPFRTSWPQLLMKRLIRHAAENGHDRIAWSTGDQQDARYALVGGGRSEQRLNGMRAFYDEMLPRETDRTIKRYGAQVTDTGIRAAVVRRGTPPKILPAHGFDITPEMREAAMAGQPLFSRSGEPEDGHAFAARVLHELGKQDELFKLPASRERTLPGTLQDLAPTMRWGGEDTRPDERDESGADKRYIAFAESGEPVYIYQRGKDVWTDVSRLKRGEGGDRIYQAVADYARNTGRRFVGDPAGLSSDARGRRTYHMLSNHIRYGDTKGFEPAPEQLEGAPERGIAPLRWPADNEGRLRALIQSFHDTTANQIPELRNLHYDFDRHAFVDSRTGAVVDRTAMAGLVHRAGSGAAPAGGRAARAAVFLRSLAQSEGSRRPALLAQVHRLIAESHGDLSPLFSRPDQGAPEPDATTNAEASREPAAALAASIFGSEQSAEPRDNYQERAALWKNYRRGYLTRGGTEHPALVAADAANVPRDNRAAFNDFLDRHTAGGASEDAAPAEVAAAKPSQAPQERPSAAVTQPPESPSPHAAQVRGWLDNAIREVKGVADVHLVDDVDQLRHVIGRGDIPNDVQGVYVSGGRQVWLVADQLGSAAEAQRKFVHEVFGHLAMEHFAPMQEAVRMVQQLRTSPTSTVGKLWDEVSRTQPGLDPTTQAKETIALMAERGSKHMVIQRLLAAVRDLIQRMGVKLKYSEAQLRQLIANAGRALREGARQLPEEDDVAAHQADMAYRRGDEDALGAALNRMSMARTPFGDESGPLRILAKPDVEASDGPATEAAVAHLIAGPKPPAASAADGSTQPLYARQAPEDPAIAAIRRRVMANAKYEGLPFRDRMKLLVQRWTGLSGLAVRQGMIDSFASIGAYEKLLNEGKLLDASASPYKQTVATQNLPSVMTAIMHTGVPIWQDGAYVRAPEGRKGLIEMFSPVVNHSDGNLLPQWELYAAARRAGRLIGEQNPDGTSRERLFTQQDIDQVMQLGTKYPEFGHVFNDWQQFNGHVLDMAQEAGLIDPKSRAIWERNDYVPFYRAVEDASGTVNSAALRRAISEQSPGIRTLHGGTQPLEDVFESMLMNTAHLVDSSFKNRAAQSIVTMFDGVATDPLPMDRQAVDIDVPQIRRALGSAGINLAEKLTPEQSDRWLTFFRGVKPSGDNVISVRFGGKPRYYEVHDPLLYQSITQMAPDGVSGLLRQLGFTAAKNFVTRMATAMPSFMVRNFIRDTTEAWVQNHIGLKPFISAAQGFKTAILDDWRGKDKIVHDLMLAGAGGDAVYDNQPGKIKKILTREIAHYPERMAASVLKTVVSPRRAWQAYTKVQQASENANRIAIYKAARKNGASHADAAYQAHDLLNFQQHGAWAGVRFAVGALPFLNARMQGFDRLLRSYHDNRGAFALKGAMLVGLTAATMALGSGNPEYDELEDWDRDTYWHFFAGGVHFRIPKPFELGSLFGTLPERAFRLMQGEDKARDVGQSILRVLSDTFAMNPIPPAAKPVIEDVTNHDFFTGRPIVPEAMQGNLPQLQTQPWTSPTLTALSGSLPEWMPDALRSPMRLEHFIRGYTSAVGMQAFTAADGLAREFGAYPEAPTKPWYEELPAGLVSTSAPRSTKWMDELYQMQTEANAATKAVTQYAQAGQLKDARQVVQEKGQQIAARGELNVLAKAMSGLNKQSKLVLESNLSADQKQQLIERINERRAQIARMVAPLAPRF